MADKTHKSAEKGDVDRLISLAEAAEISGFSQGYLRRLMRERKVWGRKIGRDWLTTEKAVKDYLLTERHPGPKKKNL